MAEAFVRFNVKDQPEFFSTLKSRVNQYFKENKVSKYANMNMYLKTLFMFTLYFTPYILLVTGQVTTFSSTLLMWAIMGFGVCGIGLAVMHDANHGAYSRITTLNGLMRFSLNFIGGFPANWRIQHNVLHHTFTNIDGFDEDISKQGIMRFSPNQPKHWFYRFQILYAPLLYCILTLYWFLGKDYEQLIRYRKKGLLKTQGISFASGLVQIFFHKLWYITLFLIIPIVVVDLPWWQTLMGFLLMHSISGLLLALIFQAAHVTEDASFFEPDKDGSVENNWAIHQLKTTANFANGNPLLSWLIGGLNYQIEHHLFPNICHVHLPAISKIVKKTAGEFNLPYYQYHTFAGAIKSHFVFLYKLGVARAQ